MRTLARRHRELTDEVKVLDAQLARLVGETAPDMVVRHGVGPQSAAQLRRYSCVPCRNASSNLRR